MQITPKKVRLKELSKIYWDCPHVTLNRVMKKTVDECAQFVKLAAKKETPIYGVNTGFGKLSEIRIPEEQTKLLQRNLILSHCCGVGKPLSKRIVRLIMVLKILSLGRLSLIHI